MPNHPPTHHQESRIESLKQVWLIFVYRKANQAAYALANFVRKNSFMYNLFLSPPFLKEVLYVDIWGATRPHQAGHFYN